MQMKTVIVKVMQQAIGVYMDDLRPILQPIYNLLDLRIKSVVKLLLCFFLLFAFQLVPFGNAIAQTKKAPKVKIHLISPTRKQPVKSYRPLFEWKMEPKMKGVTFALIIKSITPDAKQKKYDRAKAFKKLGKVIFKQSDIKKQSFSYPKDQPALDSNTTFYWTVEAYDANKKLIPIIDAEIEPIFFQTLDHDLYCTVSIDHNIVNGVRCRNPFNPTNPPITLHVNAFASYTDEWRWKIPEIPLYSTWHYYSFWYPPFDITFTDPNPTPGMHEYTLVVDNGFSCFQEIHFQVYLYPRLNYKIYPSIICSNYDNDATLEVLNLPSGWTVNWDWSDTGTVPWTPLGQNNPQNTNAISTSCLCTPDGFVKRWFRATVTGGNLPLDIIPNSPCNPMQKVLGPLKIWCPTVPGNINILETDGLTLSDHSAEWDAANSMYKICSDKDNDGIANYPIVLNLSINDNCGTNISWSPSNPSTTITSPNNYIYSATVKNGEFVESGNHFTYMGCSEKSTSVKVHVEDPLSVSISGTTEVCPNDDAEVHITNQLPAGTQIKWFYQVNCVGDWYPSGVTNSTQQNTNSIGNLGPYQYSPPFMIPTESLCWKANVSSSTETCVPVESNFHQINVMQPPCPPVISASNHTLNCPGSGSTVVLTASIPTCGTGPFTYEWLYNGSIVGTTQSITVSNRGPYIVKAWDKLHCDFATSLPYIFEDCVVSASIAGPCCADKIHEIELTANPNSQPNLNHCGLPYTYYWYTEPITNEYPNGAHSHTISVTPTGPIKYCVKVTNAQGCTATACHPVIICPQN